MLDLDLCCAGRCLQTFYEEPEIDEPDEVEVFLQNVASGKVLYIDTSLWQYVERSIRCRSCRAAVGF
eukprot:47583-Eustigmatos_ZCMA.PRE.1